MPSAPWEPNEVLGTPILISWRPYCKGGGGGPRLLVGQAAAPSCWYAAVSVFVVLLVLKALPVRRGKASKEVAQEDT